MLVAVPKFKLPIYHLLPHFGVLLPDSQYVIHYAIRHHTGENPLWYTGRLCRDYIGEVLD